MMTTLLVVAIKKALQKLLTPVLDRQVAYNAANARVTTHLKEWMEALDYQYAPVSRQIEALERSRAEVPERAPRIPLESREIDAKERQRIYLQYFEGRKNVIDIGALPEGAFTHLNALPDDSVGRIIAAQVTEHLPPRRVIELIELCHRKLASGGRLAVETPTPTCSKGPSDVRPAHPDTLPFLFEAADFVEVELRLSGFGLQVYAVIGRKDVAHDVS